MPDLCPHCGAKQPEIRVAFCPSCRHDVDEPWVHPETGQPIREPLGLTISYATEAEFQSSLGKSRYAPRGKLVVVAKGVEFVAGYGSGFEMRRIRAVKWMVPWTAYVWLTIINLLFLIPLMYCAATSGLMVGPTLVVFFVLGMTNLAGFSSPDNGWLRVDFLDELDKPFRAYFTVYSILQRWSGGGFQVYALFKQLAGQGDIVIPPVEPDTGISSDRPGDLRFHKL